MNNLIHLKEGLFFIEVPEETKDIKILLGNLHFKCFLKRIEYEKQCIELLEGNWKILGTFTKDKISFDVSPYLDKTERWGNTWKNYKRTDKEEFSISTPQECFYSLLNSKGYYWENPMGEKPSDDWDWNDGDSLHNNIEANIQWQSFQNKLIKGIGIIIEKQ